MAGGKGIRRAYSAWNEHGFSSQTKRIKSNNMHVVIDFDNLWNSIFLHVKFLLANNTIIAYTGSLSGFNSVCTSRFNTANNKKKKKQTMKEEGIMAQNWFSLLSPYNGKIVSTSCWARWNGANGNETEHEKTEIGTLRSDMAPGLSQTQISTAENRALFNTRQRERERLSSDILRLEKNRRSNNNKKTPCEWNG